MTADTRSTLRLFLAAWPTDEVRKRIVAWRERAEWPAGAALVPAERLHLTLHFIGSVPVGRLEALQQALPTARAQPFTLRLAQAQVWPAGVAVLEPQGTPQELLALHADLAGVLRSQGLAVEARAWRAHVTVSRKAQGARLPPLLDHIRWPMQGGYVLARSLPHGGYALLQRYGAVPS
jgi:2'-5' RNA ligase